MRSGEGFLLVYSVTDRARYVNKTKKYMRLGEEFVLVYARYDKTIEGKRSMREHAFVSGGGGMVCSFVSEEQNIVEFFVTYEFEELLNNF